MTTESNSLLKLSQATLLSLGAEYNKTLKRYGIRVGNAAWVYFYPESRESSCPFTVSVERSNCDPVRKYNGITTVNEVLWCLIEGGYDMGKEHTKEAIWYALKPDRERK